MLFGLFSRRRRELAPVNGGGHGGFATDTAGETTKKRITAVITQKSVVADGIVKLVLRRTTGGAFPAWQPGAHVDLVLDDGLVRQYSLCGNPRDRQSLVLGVLREESGRGGSVFVHDRLQVGDTINLEGPRNHFALIPAERYIFIAGGIGITPILPMIKELQAKNASWTLNYGGRKRSSMAFIEELEDYGNRVSICPQDESGLLDLGAILSKPEDGTVIYCCGPEPLLNAVEQRCSGWPEGALHLERFAPKAITDARAAKPFTAHLLRSGKTIFVPSNRSLASALADAGIKVATSCNEGTCGTCETAVCGGIPDHRDSVLSEAERKSNNIMMVCVSRALTTDIELDL